MEQCSTLMKNKAGGHHASFQDIEYNPRTKIKKLANCTDQCRYIITCYADDVLNILFVLKF